MQLHPQRIGPYQVVRMIGAGGMGTVFEVRHPRFPRSLALKVINTRTASERALGRFWREAELLARIKHPGVVAIHQLGRSPEGPYIVEDLIDGRPLDDVIEERPFLPQQAAQIARDLAVALEAVHAEGILHRDLKPQNVMLNAQGKPVLLDFGLARDVNAEQLTRTGDLIGTPAYMSPEQARGVSPKELGPPVDVYGLAAILFHMVAGRPPYESGSLLQAVAAAIAQDPEWPSEAPGPLVQILKVAMAKSTDERYPTIAAFRADLDAFLAGESVDAGERLALVTQRRRRQTLVRVLVALAVLVGVTLGGLGLWRATGSPASPTSTAPTAPVAQPAPDEGRPPAFTGLWNLKPGEQLRYRTWFEERESAARIRLGVWFVATAAAGPPGQVQLDVTIEAATVGFGSSLVGGAAFDGKYDSRTPSKSPLSAVGEGVGQRFSFLLHQETGAVSRMEGVDAIGERVARAIRRGEGRAIPNFEQTIKIAFTDAFIGQIMETLFHVRVAAPLPWVEEEVPHGRRFVVAEADRPRLLRTLTTTYAHRPEHVFGFAAQARYADGRLQRSRVTQDLRGRRTRRGNVAPLPPLAGGLPLSVRTTWSFHLQRPGDAPLSDYGE